MVTGPTFTPTPTQTPNAPNAIIGRVSMVTSGGFDYAALANGSEDAQLDYQPSDDDIRIGQTGLIWAEGEAPSWQIDRALLEFDTTAILTPPTSVVLRFRLIGKLPGFAVPQAIHRGTWTRTPTQLHPKSLWWAYEPEPLVTFLENDTTGIEPQIALERPVTVALPPEAIVLGGITRLMLRTTLEGQAPPVGFLNCDTCMQIAVYDNANLLISR
jgi:hypothetical protein